MLRELFSSDSYVWHAIGIIVAAMIVSARVQKVLFINFPKRGV